MRRRLFASSSTLARTFLPIAALASVLSGCGGSDDGDSNSGSGSGNVNAVRTGVDISWSDRSRNFLGPSSALSARITFVGGSTTSTDVVTIADRQDTTAGYIGTYATSSAVRTGGVTIHLDFYAGRGASGAKVATADTDAILKPDGTISRANGTTLQFIPAASELASVAIVAPATVTVGQTVTAGFTALNKQGQVVALTPGSAIFDGSGAITVTPDGTVTGVRSGAGSLRVTVDGLSATATIQAVAANSSAVVEIAQPVNDLERSPTGQRILVTTPGTGANPNQLLELNPFTGEIVKRYQVGSNPGPIGVAMSRNLVYVGLTGAGSFRQVDLNAGMLGPVISLGTTSSGAWVASDIAVSRTDPEKVVVAENVSGFDSRLTYYQGGVARTNRTNGYYKNDVIAFNPNGLEVYGLSTSSSSAELTRNVVSNTGIVQTQTANNLVSGNSLIALGTRLFSSGGRVVSTTDFSAVGQFQVQSNTFAIDSGLGRAYFIVEDRNSSTGETVLQLQTFSTETYTLLSTKTIPGAYEPTFGRIPRRLIVTATDHLALSTTDGRILLIDTTKL